MTDKIPTSSLYAGMTTLIARSSFVLDVPMRSSVVTRGPVSPLEADTSGKQVSVLRPKVPPWREYAANTYFPQVIFLTKHRAVRESKQFQFRARRDSDDV